MNTRTADSETQRPLIARCVGGEDRAWRDLCREYCPIASRFLRRMGVPPNDLEDACQEVFVQVFRYLPHFEPRADFRTWLYKLCLSQAGRVRRRRRVHEALHWLLRRDSAAMGVAGEPEWSVSMITRRVNQALDRMKPMHRVVLVLYEFEGIEGEGIASILHCPPATIRRRLHYARQEFESFLRAETAEEGKS